MLRGLSEYRCPECGRAFDPNDRRTMRIPTIPGVVLALNEPIGRGLRRMILISSIMVVWGGLIWPLGEVVYPIGAAFLFPLVPFVGVRMLLGRYLAKRYSLKVQRGSGRFVVWPLLILILAYSGLLFRTTVWLHRPLLDWMAYREYYAEDTREFRGPRWVGILVARELRVTPGSVEFRFANRVSLYRSYNLPSWGTHVVGEWYLRGSWDQDWWLPTLY